MDRRSTRIVGAQVSPETYRRLVALSRAMAPKDALPKMSPTVRAVLEIGLREAERGGVPHVRREGARAER